MKAEIFFHETVKRDELLGLCISTSVSVTVLVPRLSSVTPSSSRRSGTLRASLGAKWRSAKSCRSTGQSSVAPNLVTAFSIVAALP